MLLCIMITSRMVHSLSVIALTVPSGTTSPQRLRVLIQCFHAVASSFSFFLSRVASLH